MFDENITEVCVDARWAASLIKGCTIVVACGKWRHGIWPSTPATEGEACSPVEHINAKMMAIR